MKQSLSRRHVLRSALAATALCPWSQSNGVAGTCIGSMSLGFSLYGMREIVVEQAIDELKRIGYDSVEFCLAEGFDTNPERLNRKRREQLRRKLNDSGMCLRALMENLPLSVNESKNWPHREKLKRAAQLAHDLSPTNPPIIETILGSGKWLDVRTAFADELRQWTTIAERENITIVIKPHRFHAVDNPEAALWLMRQVGSDRIALGYDYSHYAHRDIDMDRSIDELRDYIRFVHVKDAVPDGDRVRFALPGSTGDIDYPRLLKRLDEIQYRGDVCVEVSSQIWKKEGYQPFQAAKQSYDAVSRAFHIAGISRPT